MATVDQLAIQSFNSGLEIGRQMERDDIIKKLIETQTQSINVWKWTGAEFTINLGSIIAIIEGQDIG